MPAFIDSKEMFDQKEIQGNKNVECSLVGLADQSDSETRWIKLHQMFDK